MREVAPLLTNMAGRALNLRLAVPRACPLLSSKTLSEYIKCDEENKMVKGVFCVILYTVGCFTSV